MSNCMLSEEKNQTKLINANVITRHNAIVNRNIRSASLYLFDKV